LFAVHREQTKFELVSKDYYQDELRYQDKIDGAANAALEAPISIQVNDEIISIEFPDAQKNANITGEAWFYCSVDATKDKRFVLSVDSTGIQRIERKGLQKGDYQIKISYEINQKKYYVAQQLHLH